MSFYKPSKTASPRNRERQDGSAYIIALMVLVVLTVLGLGLALITQTEMQIGSNERTLQRVFYAADSGLDTSAARALVDRNLGSTTFTFTDPDAITMFNIRHEVLVSPFYPIMTAPCNLCEINNAGEYQGSGMQKVNFGVTARAERLVATNPDPQARKMLSTLIEVQPYDLNPEDLAPLNDPAALELLVF